MLPEYQKGIKYSQSNRWYHYTYNKDFPLPRSYIYKHSANVHIIPANENITKGLKQIKKNDKVYLEGFLVYVKGKLKNRPGQWKSSLKRNDTGPGSCEVLYLKKIILGDQVIL